jgi:hypothetical protein
MNHVRQTVSAVGSVEHATGRLPAGCLVDSEMVPIHGWQVQLLPYVEEQELFDQVDLSKPWRDPSQRNIFQSIVEVWTNPRSPDAHTDAETGYALSDYAANMHVLGSPKRWSTREITDGAGKTILLGETAGNRRPWGHDSNWRDPGHGIGNSLDDFGEPGTDTGLTIFGFADGHAASIPNDVDPEVLRALATPTGGEQLEDDW